MAPFTDDRALFEQKESGIAPDDGLERRLICQVERIFCSCEVAPALDGLLIACRET